MIVSTFFRRETAAAWTISMLITPINYINNLSSALNAIWEPATRQLSPMFPLNPTWHGRYKGLRSTTCWTMVKLLPISKDMFFRARGDPLLELIAYHAISKFALLCTINAPAYSRLSHYNLCR